MANLKFSTRSPGIVMVFADDSNGDLCAIVRTSQGCKGIDRPYKAIPMFAEGDMPDKITAIPVGTYDDVKAAVTKLFS